jgi:DNA-binding transcriptional MocR family regulator
VWITLPEHADMNVFVPWCQKKYKLSAIPGSMFSLTGDCRNYLRLAVAFHSKDTRVEAGKKLCVALGEFLNAAE